MKKNIRCNLFNLTEAAKFCGVSETTFALMANRYKFPYHLNPFAIFGEEELCLFLGGDLVDLVDKYSIEQDGKLVEKKTT